MVSILTCPSNSYFNPRSREGSDNSVKPFVIRIDSISIHAPARGATLFRNVMQLETQISIHAPARGATVKELCEIVWGEFQSTLPRGERPMGGFKFLGNNGFQSTLPRVERQRLFLYLDIPGNFNPRSREWSDPLKVAPLQVMPISIHAPASGATDIIGRDVRTVQFQSTLPRVERRCGMGRGRCKGAISIHAPASGATTADHRVIWSSKDFNPRSREWSDYGRQIAEQVLDISIHAPASGATPSDRLRIVKDGFQSTLPRVERQQTASRQTCHQYFNPRSREWSDKCQCHVVTLYFLFQSTLPRVERPQPEICFY